MINRLRPGIVAIALAAALSISGCGAGADDGDGAFAGAHVPATEFQAALDTAGTVVVDVRTPEEFAAGHLPDAVNIDIAASDFAAQVADLDPDARYAVYCRTDNRSSAAIEIMTEQGVTQTTGLDGGIEAWTGDIVVD
jgi:rhodanese-related sulfurtransferase